MAVAKQVIEYREWTEQANTAMLVIQDMTLQKMNDTLHAKEKGKKPKCNQIFAGGKGRHLTHPESIAAIRADYDTCAKAKEQKMQRQSNHERRKLDRAKVDIEWEAIKKGHVMKVQEWEADIRKIQSLLESFTGLEAFLQGLIALASYSHKTDKNLVLSKTL